MRSLEREEKRETVNNEAAAAKQERRPPREEPRRASVTQSEQQQAGQQAPNRSEDPKVDRLRALALATTRQLGARFCIQGQELEAEEVAAHNGLLPLLMHCASQVFERAFDRRLPVLFEIDKTALCEVVPLIDPASPDAIFSVFAMCMHFGMEEIQRKFTAKPESMVNGELIPLDWLYEEWYQEVQRNRYRIRMRQAAQPEAQAGVAR
jgi:hypothetical protein